MGFLATKQGEGGRGIENTAKSASQRGLWAVYWFGHFFIIVIMVFSVLFAYMSHRVTHGAPYSGGEIAPFAWQGQWLLLRIICHLQHHSSWSSRWKGQDKLKQSFFSKKESMSGLNWLTPKIRWPKLNCKSRGYLVWLPPNSFGVFQSVNLNLKLRRGKSSLTAVLAARVC